MKTWGIFGGYLAAAILCAALAAPWVYYGCQPLGRFKFDDVLNRLLLLFAFGGSFLVLRAQGVLSLSTLGLLPSPRLGSHLGVGAAIATASVAVVLGTGLATGALEWDGERTGSTIAAQTALNLLVASLVGLSEEVFFRGCLLGWLSQKARPGIALGIVTVFYAIVHFLDPTKSMKSFTDVNWLSGFAMLGNYVLNLTDDARWVPQFALLVLIGASLGWCFLRTSRLYLSIGLHAGWVFAGREMTLLTDVNNGAANWWFGFGKLIGSPITIFAVGAVFLLMLWLCKHPKIQGNSPPA